MNFANSRLKTRKLLKTNITKLSLFLILFAALLLNVPSTALADTSTNTQNATQSNAPAVQQTSTQATAPATTLPTTSQGIAQASTAPNTGNVLLLSDLHFNPFANPQLVTALANADYSQWEAIFAAAGTAITTKYSSETDYGLLNSTLKEIYHTNDHPDFIILSGDFLAHNFNENYVQTSGDQTQYGLDQFVAKTISFVGWELDRLYPNTPVYFTLGNNDSYTGDYTCIPDGEFLHTTADSFFQYYIKDETNHDAFYGAYPVWGYYTVVPPLANNARIIVINTNYFSPKYVNPAGQNPAQQQLAWLDAQLAASQSKGEKVWIIGHIPPGVDVYSTLNNTQKTVKTMWQEADIDAYIKEAQTYSKTIQATFAGHTHMDDFRLVTDDQANPVTFVHITPAITPVFGNNPAFQVMTYDRNTFAMLDYQTYYINMTASSRQWASEYDFDQTYNQSSIDPISLGKVANSIQTDATVRTNYITNYGVSIQPAQIANIWQAYLNGILHLTAGSYPVISQ